MAFALKCKLNEKKEEKEEKNPLTAKTVAKGILLKI